ncbi:hypothetical protein ACQKLX_04235 [Bosea sp. NPDC003192]|uniref:hypothetical protein n=1 Tax=Bosea sp. NPDC003192 TaxID=3390551 RepID=UPI003D047E22
MAVISQGCDQMSLLWACLIFSGMAENVRSSDHKWKQSRNAAKAALTAPLQMRVTARGVQVDDQGIDS